MSSLLKQRTKKGKPQGIWKTSGIFLASLNAFVIRDSICNTILPFTHLDGKQWLHPADLLTDGGVLYPVKVSEVFRIKCENFDSARTTIQISPVKLNNTNLNSFQEIPRVKKY